jgi:hypothetical protein
MFHRGFERKASTEAAEFSGIEFATVAWLPVVGQRGRDRG